MERLKQKDVQNISNQIHERANRCRTEIVNILKGMEREYIPLDIGDTSKDNIYAIFWTDDGETMEYRITSIILNNEGGLEFETDYGDVFGEGNMAYEDAVWPQMLWTLFQYID